MGWIVFVLIQAIVIWSGIRQEQRAGMWSWSKLVFTLAFAGLEVVVLLTPIIYLDIKGALFVPVFCGAAVVAAANFVWFIIVCRRWRLPNGRTSLEAYRDEHPGK
jgi:hypothetical protein